VFISVDLREWGALQCFGADGGRNRADRPDLD